MNFDSLRLRTKQMDKIEKVSEEERNEILLLSSPSDLDLENPPIQNQFVPMENQSIHNQRNENQSIQNQEKKLFQRRISPPQIPPFILPPVEEKNWLKWALQVFKMKNFRLFGAWRRTGAGGSAEPEEEFKEPASIGEESRVRRLAFGYEAPPDEHKGLVLLFYNMTSNILGVMLLTFAIGVLIVLTLIFMAKWSDGTWRKW